MPRRTVTGRPVPSQDSGRMFGRHEYPARGVFGWPLYRPTVRKRRSDSALGYVGRHRRGVLGRWF